MVQFVPAAIQAAAAIGQAIANRSTANRTMSAQERANQQARDWQEKTEDQRRLEWDRYQEQLRQQWEAEQARLAPFRQAALGVLASHGTDISGYLQPQEFTAQPYTEGATVPEGGVAAMPTAPGGQPWGSMRWGDSMEGLFGSDVSLQTGGGSLADIAAAQPAAYGGFVDPMRDYFYAGQDPQDLGTLGGVPVSR